DAAENGNSVGIGRVHAKVRQAACPKVLATCIWSIRSIVQDTQLIRQAGKIDVLACGVARQVLIFVDGVEIWAALHLHYCIVRAIIEIQILPVLQIGSLSRNSLLIVRYRTIDQVGLDILCDTAMMQLVDGLPVLLV